MFYSRASISGPKWLLEKRDACSENICVLLGKVLSANKHFGVLRIETWLILGANYMTVAAKRLLQLGQSGDAA